MTSGMTAQQKMEDMTAQVPVLQVGNKFVKKLNKLRMFRMLGLMFGLPVCYFRLAAGSTGPDDPSNNLLPAVFDLIRVATLHPEQGRTILLHSCLSDPLQ